MKDEPDPYEPPGPARDHAASDPTFPQIPTAALVVLFFIPSACYAFALFSGFYFGSEAIAQSALFLTLATGIGVPALSAYIDTRRGNGHVGTFALLTFVHLLAQVLAFLILRFGIAILLPG